MMLFLADRLDLDEAGAAFAVLAEVEASLAGEPAVAAKVAVPDVASVRRVAIQWMGRDGFDLATEAPALVATTGEGVGPTVRLARVLTAPAGPGGLSVQVSAKVTGMTCGRPLSGQVLRLEAGETVVEDLSFAMPDCTAVGESVAMLLPEADAVEKVVATSAP